METGPVPTDEEAAAIVAAMELLWPRTVVVAVGPAQRPTNAWRFSGRWWTGRDPAASRRRP